MQNWSGDSRTLHFIVKELGVRKRAGCKKVILEDGSVARDAKQEQRWWLKHFASQLGGSAATEDGPRLPEIGSVISTKCRPPGFDEVADVVAILPKLRATAPDDVPNEARLETTASKICSRTVKRKTVPQMVERGRSSQMGGMPGRSAETGSHVGRLFAERQRECKASYALVFVDAVLRDALWSPSRTLRCTRALFEEFGLDPALGEELWHQLQTEPAVAQVIGIPERERQIWRIGMRARGLTCVGVSSRLRQDVEWFRGTLWRTFSSTR